MSLYFTESGIKAFRLKEAELTDRVRASGQEVGDAAGMNCDWHDNAGFDEARRTLEFNSQRLGEIRAALGQAIIVTINEQTDAVRIGSTVQVTIVDPSGNEEVKEFTIGAYAETDAKLGLIAYDSPMASVLLTHSEGETLEDVKIGGKVVEISIDKILPPSAKYTALISTFYPFKE